MSFKFIRKILSSMLAVVSTASAFPPAPYYTLYGIVRDQVGQTLNGQAAEIVLLKGGVEVGRTPLTTGQFDQNYELNIRIDAARSGTTMYSAKAVAALGDFSLVVSMGGVWFYPIEVNGTLKAGKGGERTRLDLNLGEDANKDGLPDAWEEWQLYLAGYYPDADGKWNLSLLGGINGHFMNSRLTNQQAYIAGTFAGDATSTFELSLKEKLPQSVRFEFYAITGKVYTIESTLDMKTWTQVPFAVGAPGKGSQAYQATDVGILTVFTAPRAASGEFFRLTVR